MAQLKRALGDGHLYILAGPNKGTWQVSEEGARMLRQLRVRLPVEGESVALDRTRWRYLSDHGLVYKYNIPYERHPISIGDSKYELGRGASNTLPLVLRLPGAPAETWSLVLELGELSDEVVEELWRAGAASIAISGASDGPIPIRYLQVASRLVELAPQSAPYIVQWLDGAHRTHDFDTVPAIPGLNSTPRGNVFVESRRGPRRWNRCLPGGAVPFWGTLRWLARSEHDSGWPGAHRREGGAQGGWQLWRLTVDEGEPVALEAIRTWLAERQLVLTERVQRLDLVTPPSAVTPDGWALMGPHRPVVIGCYPPPYPVAGLRHRMRLKVAQVTANRRGDDATQAVYVDLAGPSSSARADTPLFACWPRPMPGDYRIQMVGDVNTEPLLIRVLHGSSDVLAAPPWLHGLTCRLTTPAASFAFNAFSSEAGETQADGQSPSVIVSPTLRSALADAQWEISPAGVPVNITWTWSPGGDTSDGKARREHRVESSDEFTQLWRESMWPACESSGVADILLDAGSYGRITCTIRVVDSAPSGHRQRCLTRAQRAELSWLARCCLALHSDPTVPLPRDLRGMLDRFVTCPDPASETEVVAATAVLRGCARVPAWVLPRLRPLLQADSRTASPIADGK